VAAGSASRFLDSARRGGSHAESWILWWDSASIPFTTAWWNAPNFFPAHGAFAFSEHLVGLSVISSPVIWLSHNPQLGYNVAFLLTYALSGMAAYWLGLELTGRRDAAAIAGLAFACLPYRTAQTPHIQVLASFWMPLALVGLHRYLRDGRVRWVLLFAGAWLLQALSNGYYLIFFPVLLALWGVWFLRPRQWRRAGAIGVAFLVPALLLVPVLLKYSAVHEEYGLVRNVATIRGLSAMWRRCSMHQTALAVWGPPSGVSSIGRRAVSRCGDSHAGRRRRGRAQVVACCHRCRSRAGAGVCLLRRGRRGDVHSGARAVADVLWPPARRLWPVRLAHAAPGFESLRVPARLAMQMMLCLSVAGALAFALLSRAWSESRRRTGAAVLGALLLLEGWPTPMPMWDVPSRWDIQAREVPARVLVLPMLNAYNEAQAMYRGMAHGRPLVNGYSGYVPPWYDALREGLDDRDPAILDRLAEAGVTQVAITDRSDKDGDWKRYVGQRATLVRRSADGLRCSTSIARCPCRG
jgi:hypothetical protein